MQFYNVYFLFIFSFFSVLKEARAQTVGSLRRPEPGKSGWKKSFLLGSWARTLHCHCENWLIIKDPKREGVVVSDTKIKTK